MNGKVLVTGAAGFIGFHTVVRLISEGYKVVGLDNINDYYSPQLKYARLKELGVNQEKIGWYSLVKSSIFEDYRFIRMNLEDKQQLFSLFQTEQFDFVINLAAQAGVRYSIDNPDVYIQSNIVGFHYLLEACRAYPVKHLLHASSSSVYGDNSKIPFSEDDKVDLPVSLYAATKKSNELTAHAYSHLYQIPVSCLRFFTVYGPWGRPDMAPMLFAKAIVSDQEIKVFNNGDMERDFTYVDDIVDGIFRILIAPFEENSILQYRILNIGNGAPVKLLDFISELEKGLNKPAMKRFLPMQMGDVSRTWADQEKIVKLVGVKSNTNLSEGLRRFSKWYLEFFGK